MRDTIFIGHANPEDDEFTLWLHARLKNEGFNVECDITCLTGGEEDYWRVLQDILENRCCKYLLVLSKNTFFKDGVKDEFEQAKSVAKKINLKDFIIVLKIDDVPFDIRIGLNRKNQFRFDLSWSKAFKNLIIKLKKDGVPRQSSRPLSVDDWLKNRHSTQTGVEIRHEKLYSNWLAIKGLPSKFYIFEYTNEAQAKALVDEILDYPVFAHDSYIVSFMSEMPRKIRNGIIEINYLKKIEVNVNTAFNRYDSEQFPIYEDTRRFLVRLLKEGFHRFLSNRGLLTYEMSQKTKCFYFRKGFLENDKVHFTYEERATWKQMLGEFGDSTWHLGISLHPMLYPELCYSLRSHIVFTDNGIDIWESKSKLHKARRSKGKKMFNKEWRSLLLGFLHALSDNGKTIEILLNEQNALSLPTETIKFHSRYGYIEPNSEARIVPLDYPDEETLDEDVFDELDNEANPLV